MVKKPTVISLFAGTGGSSLGYHLAGYQEPLAIDFDPHAVECLKQNFPETTVWQKDVTQVTGSEILTAAKLSQGELDVLDGSPPCQGFSLAGKRNVSDKRNSLFESYARLVTELSPKVFVMENVPGMKSGNMRGKFNEILGALKALDYNVKCAELNSKDYEVPQARKRLFFIGVRKDLGKLPQFPMPSAKPIKVKDVIFSKPILGPFPPTKDSHAEVFQHIPPGGGAIKYVPKEILKKYIPRMVNNKTFSFGGICKRLELNGFAPTVTKTFIEFSEPFIHPTENRYLTISELCLLCSFPHDWKLGQDYKKAYARLGNAVMPKMMQAIAETIKIKILEMEEQ